MNISNDLNNVINILKNKRVLIIGPAPELKGKKKNEFFKQFDIICGLNQLYNLNDDDYSERIDILFSTTNPESIQEVNNNKNQICKKNIKYIIGTNKWNKTREININSFNTFCSIIKQIDNKIINYDISELANNIDIYFKISNNHSGAHTGTIALIFLLSLPLKELYIDGITFYNNNSFGVVHSTNYFTIAKDKKYIMKENTHSLSMENQKNLVNHYIKNCKFHVDFDENYCPLIKNNIK